MKKKIKYLLMSATVLTLVACGNNTAKKEDTGKGNSSGTEELADEQIFTVNVPQEMPTADLSLSTDVISSVALNNVYEGIYRLNDKQELEPAGAKEKVEISEDGLTYKVKLREESKWSDGKPVTAKDYVYGWQRTVDPKTQSEYAYLHGPVKNAEAITAGDKDKSELGIKAIGDYELEITLEQPTPYFEKLLSFSTFLPQRQDIVEKYGNKYAATSENAVYNGPFVLAEFDGPGTDTEWAYEKNDTYWDKDNVKLDKIKVSVVKSDATSLSLYEDGQVEDIKLNGELAQQMANSPDFVTDKEAGVRYLELNQDKKDSPFKNENFRKAIAYSINREALATQILSDGSVAATGLVPEGVAESPSTKKDFTEETKNKVSYDATKAKDYWEKAKKELGKDKFEFNILSSDDDSTKKATEFIKGSLEDELDGLKVELSPVPFAVRLERSNSGDFSTVYGGWIADYADPSSFVDLFVTGSSYNRGKYSNAEYDQKIKSASITNVSDPEKRWQDMVDAEDIIMNDMGMIPLIQSAEAHLRSSKIKNVVVHPAGARYDYKWAYKVK
ncbi:ABC transporter substrate-binding protein [Vagococcus sp. JNUCC 83]